MISIKATPSITLPNRSHRGKSCVYCVLVDAFGPSSQGGAGAMTFLRGSKNSWAGSFVFASIAFSFSLPTFSCFPVLLSC